MHISEVSHLRSNPMIRFKEELVEGVSYTIVAYMIGDKEMWDDPSALETRGNTYDTETGDCVCAAFPKFFNVGERQDTQEQLVKEQFIECYEKRDGSMVTPILTASGKVLFKTKKSFFSDVANLANQTVPDAVYEHSKLLLQNGFTPIWEFTHPDCRIVIDYHPRDNFTLLAVRHNESGVFVAYDSLATIKGINLIQRYEMTWDEIRDSIENDTGIEGYVLLLKDGRRVKYKTHWYLEMHRTMTELRERDVAEAVANENVDDMKSLLVSQGQNIDQIVEIETRVVNEIAEIKRIVETHAHMWQGASFKVAAIGLQGCAYFSLVMSLLRGKEPNYIDYWKRNHLKDYSLRCVFNSNFGVQDDG